MELTTALSELATARQYVADGAKSVLTQRRLVERLERQGRDSLEAGLLLDCLEEMQEQYLSHRDRLEKQVLKILVPAEDE